jgi:Fic family protein
VSRGGIQLGVFNQLLKWALAVFALFAVSHFQAAISVQSFAGRANNQPVSYSHCIVTCCATAIRTSATGVRGRRSTTTWWAFDATGKQIGIVFETASPIETPMLMEKLLGWYAKEEADPILHPLLRTAIFLAIHPFQDGNGRLSRVLTNLMLLRAGYTYASYTSLESVIEHNKEAYYLALRRTQASFREAVDWEPWMLYFLRALKSQISRLRGRLAEPSAAVAASGIPDDLSPLAGQLLKRLEARGSLSVAEAADALGANRHTLKDKFTELVKKGYAKLHGKGRGAHYRRVK